MSTVLKIVCVVGVILGLAFGCFAYWWTEEYGRSVAAFIGAIAFAYGHGLVKE